MVVSVAEDKFTWITFSVGRYSALPARPTAFKYSSLLSWSKIRVLGRIFFIALAAFLAATTTLLRCALPLGVKVYFPSLFILIFPSIFAGFDFLTEVSGPNDSSKSRASNIIFSCSMICPCSSAISKSLSSLISF